MSRTDVVLLQGLADTREMLTLWNDGWWPVIRRWLAASAAISLILLVAVLALAYGSVDATSFVLPGLDTEPTGGQVAQVLLLNGLVLALHALACVAGFIAGSSLPLQAERYSGARRWIHAKGGPLAIAFVACATAFSLLTQAYMLGGATSALASQLDLSPALVVVGGLPHALPELLALFLPLSAWTIASRRGEWHQLLAATFVTTTIAVPILIAAAFVEVYVSPDLLRALAG